MIQYNTSLSKAFEEARNRPALMSLVEVEDLISIGKPSGGTRGWKGLFLAAAAWMILISGMYLYPKYIKHTRPKSDKNFMLPQTEKKSSNTQAIVKPTTENTLNEEENISQEPNKLEKLGLQNPAIAHQNIANTRANTKDIFDLSNVDGVYGPMQLPSLKEEVALKTEVPVLAHARYTMKGWKLSSTESGDFTVGIDKNMAHSGQASAYIKSGKTNFKSAWLTQQISAESYIGKRIRLTAWIKCKDPDKKAWAGLFMNLRGDEFKYAGFNNMYDKNIHPSSAGWIKCELVADVPEKTREIAFGLYKVYAGEAWIDDINLEVVGKETPLYFPLTTEAVDTSLVMTDAFQKALSMMVNQPSNLNFELLNQKNEPLHWYIGQESQHFRIYGDPTIQQNGKPSICLQSNGYKNDWNTLLQVCKAGNYLNKHIKISAWVRTAGVIDHASFIFRVDDFTAGMRPENVKEVNFKGNTNWQKVELSLDIPETATSFRYGVLLSDKGQIWMSNLNVEIEPLNHNVMVPDYFKTPINLGFEE